MRKQFFWTVSVRFLNSTELAATLNLSPTTTIKWLLDLAEVRDTAVDWEGWGLEKRGLNFQVSTSWQIPEDFVPLLVTAVTSRKAGETRPQALLRVLSGPEAVQDLAVGSASSVPAQLAVESGPHVRNAQTEFLQAVSEILTEAKDVLNKIEKASEKADEVRSKLYRHKRDSEAVNDNLDRTVQTVREVSETLTKKVTELQTQIELADDKLSESKATAARLHRLIDTWVVNIHFLQLLSGTLVAFFLALAITADIFTLPLRLIIFVAVLGASLGLAIFIPWFFQTVEEWLADRGWIRR